MLIDENETYKEYAGLWAGSSTVSLTGVEITGNRAAVDMGAGMLDRTTAIFDEVHIHDNTAGSLTYGSFIATNSSLAWTGTSSTTSGLTSSSGSYAAMVRMNSSLSAGTWTGRSGLPPEGLHSKARWSSARALIADVRRHSMLHTHLPRPCHLRHTPPGRATFDRLSIAHPLKVPRDHPRMGERVVAE